MVFLKLETQTSTFSKTGVQNNAKPDHSDFLKINFEPGLKRANEPVSSMCRVFKQCYSVFDYHLSRATLKICFTCFSFKLRYNYCLGLSISCF